MASSFKRPEPGHFLAFRPHSERQTQHKTPSVLLLSHHFMSNLAPSASDNTRRRAHIFKIEHATHRPSSFLASWSKSDGNRSRLHVQQHGQDQPFLALFSLPQSHPSQVYHHTAATWLPTQRATTTPSSRYPALPRQQTSCRPTAYSVSSTTVCTLGDPALAPFATGWVVPRQIRLRSKRAE